jgi:hypothetical protein
VRFRVWLALVVILPVLYFVLGEKPLFCDLADGYCPLDKPTFDEEANSHE